MSIYSQITKHMELIPSDSRISTKRFLLTYDSINFDLEQLKHKLAMLHSQKRSYLALDIHTVIDCKYTYVMINYSGPISVRRHDLFAFDHVVPTIFKVLGSWRWSVNLLTQLSQFKETYGIMLIYCKKISADRMYELIESKTDLIDCFGIFQFSRKTIVLVKTNSRMNGHIEITRVINSLTIDSISPVKKSIYSIPKWNKIISKTVQEDKFKYKKEFTLVTEDKRIDYYEYGFNIEQAK